MYTLVLKGQGYGIGIFLSALSVHTDKQESRSLKILVYEDEQLFAT
jgi:hypothetical protein